jgi:hypothetical protein
MEFISNVSETVSVSGLMMEAESFQNTGYKHHAHMADHPRRFKTSQHPYPSTVKGSDDGILQLLLLDFWTLFTIWYSEKNTM